MATSTQYNPQTELNAKLLAAGASKTVYALVDPMVIERMKDNLFGSQETVRRERYFNQFREAWTGKQDQYHENFFNIWHEWSQKLVTLDRKMFPFAYPTAGASEPLRHIIYDYSSIARVEGFKPRIHVFAGEYEGYKAMAEAARIEVVEHFRGDWEGVADALPENEWFFLSQPSAIDGNVWLHANGFLTRLSQKSEKPRVIMDLTYVGAVPSSAMQEKILLNLPCVRNVVFSLSKPFGAYYDRIGGVFCRNEDLGLFGNRWFKNLTSIALGTELMSMYDVFSMAKHQSRKQILQASKVSEALGFHFKPSHVFVLATAETFSDEPMANYLRRADRLRVCLTPGMSLLG